MRTGLSTVGPAMASALQWRLLMLLALGSLLPALLVALPLWSALSDQLDLAVSSGQWASRFDVLAFTDVVNNLGKGSAFLTGSLLVATLLAVALSPLLTGLSITAARNRRAAGFGELMHGALAEYWKLLRLMLWAIIPLGLAVGVLAGLLYLADKQAHVSILESAADSAGHWALLVGALVLVVAHACVESARAQFVTDPVLRSGMRALWRGIRSVARRPLPMLLVYLAIALAGYGLAGLLGLWRIGVPHASVPGLLLAFALTQLIAMTLGWMRTARLFAYARMDSRG